MSNLQIPFKYDFVGSFLRPEKLKNARKEFEAGSISYGELKNVEDECIIDLVTKIKKPSFVWLAIPDRKFIERSWNAVWNAICDKKRK